MAGPGLLRIVAVEVRSADVRFVLFADTARMRTRDVPGLASGALRALPGLASHACDNGAGTAFAEESRDTETAHLAEHVAVELLARAAPHHGNRGETRWDFAADGRGTFRVTLEHPDDIACSAAMRGAVELMEAWATGDAGDVEGALERVRSARRR